MLWTYAPAEWLYRAARAERERETRVIMRISEAKGVSGGSSSSFAGRLTRLAVGLPARAAALRLRRETSTSGLNAPAMNVYVVAGFETLRRGLMDLVAKERSTNLAGEAPSLEQMAADQRCLQADVVVIDMDVVSPSGMSEVYERLGERIGDLKILFLGGQSDARDVGFNNIPLLMRLQSLGFITKDGPPDRLLKALAVVGYGGFVCETRTIKQMAIGVGVLSGAAQSGDDITLESPTASDFDAGWVGVETGQSSSTWDDWPRAGS